MKAIAINHYGASNQFELMDLKLRGIQADEVVIDVRAAGVNPVDWKLRRGDLRHQFNWELPIVLGWDVAGIVSEIGSDVANVKVGDAVFARPDMSNRGAYAEQTIVKANRVVVKPINLSFEEAAAVPLTAITAWQVIHKRLKVRKGEAVLIQAGAGGIGIFAIQFAHQLGATVVTTARTENAEFLARLGANQIVDYRAHRITDLPHTFDAVFDTVGQITDGMAVLKPGGRLVSIESDPSDQDWPDDKTASYWWTDPNSTDLSLIKRMIESDQVRVPINEIVPVTVPGVMRAHELSKSHHSVGKIVISMKT